MIFHLVNIIHLMHPWAGRAGWSDHGPDMGRDTGEDGRRAGMVRHSDGATPDRGGEGSRGGVQLIYPPYTLPPQKGF